MPRALPSTSLSHLCFSPWRSLYTGKSSCSHTHNVFPALVFVCSFHLSCKGSLSLSGTPRCLGSLSPRHRWTVSVLSVYSCYFSSFDVIDLCVRRRLEDEKECILAKMCACVWMACLIVAGHRPTPAPKHFRFSEPLMQERADDNCALPLPPRRQ